MPRLRRIVAPVLTLVVLGATSAAPADADVTCPQDWRPAEPAAHLDRDGAPTDPARPLPPSPGPGYRAMHLFCAGRYVTSAWMAPVETPSTVINLGRAIVAGAQWPSVVPAVNPAVGITGLAAWFWATPDGGTLRLQPGNGPDLDVELRVQQVRWRFGADIPGATGWGVPYPTPSPVRAVFERSGTATVTVEAVLVGRLRGEELDVEVPGSHRVVLRYPVAQVRSLLHAG
jgi:hypothetical protein